MVQASALRYEVVEGWEQLPAGYSHPDVAGVSVDSRDRVYLYCRAEHPVLIYERDGTFVGSWGDGLFKRPHGITVGPDDMIYVADDVDHTVHKYTLDGTHVFTLGVSGQSSDSGYDGKNVESISHGGPPFNRPTNIGIAQNGDLYISDGYGNCRVHHFSPDGTLIRSWGEPGIGDGQFMLPHGIWVHQDGRVFVADRQNDRIQIFTPEGKHLETWTDLQRPTQLFIDKEGLIYASELLKPCGSVSFTNGPCEEGAPGRVSVLSPSGQVLARWSGDDPAAIGGIFAPHSISVDSEGSIYVAEVTQNVGVNRGLVPAGTHTFQKFVRK